MPCNFGPARVGELSVFGARAPRSEHDDEPSVSVAREFGMTAWPGFPGRQIDIFRLGDLLPSSSVCRVFLGGPLAGRVGEGGEDGVAGGEGDGSCTPPSSSHQNEGTTSGMTSP